MKNTIKNSNGKVLGICDVCKRISKNKNSCVHCGYMYFDTLFKEHLARDYITTANRNNTYRQFNPRYVWTDVHRTNHT